MQDIPYTPKIKAMIRLTQSLDRGESWSAREIAQRFGVNRRTAQRWMAELGSYVTVDTSLEAIPGTHFERLRITGRKPS
jgi:predicted DNA-binding transcriptional regulator YafY